MICLYISICAQDLPTLNLLVQAKTINMDGSILWRLLKMISFLRFHIDLAHRLPEERTEHRRSSTPFWTAEFHGIPVRDIPS